MRVSLPTGDLLFSNRVVRDSIILIGGQKFPADLVALDMRDFDVVLGMDWLSRHRATLDCYKKEVKFHRQGKLEVKFRGIRRELSYNMISAMAAQRMLRKGCQGYLAYVVETEKEGILVTPQTRGSVNYPSTRGIQVDVEIPDTTSENQAESPLYVEFYPNTIPV